MLGGKNIKIYLKLILIIDDETKFTLIESIVSLNKSLKERFKTFVSRFSELSSKEVIFPKNDFNKLLNSSISLINFKVLTGNIPEKNQNIAIKWVKKNQENLLNKWDNLVITSTLPLTKSRLDSKETINM